MTPQPTPTPAVRALAAEHDNTTASATARSRPLWARAETRSKPFPNQVSDRLDRDPQVRKHTTRDPVLIPEQPQEYMFGLDRLVPHRPRLVLRAEEDLACLRCELHGHAERIAAGRGRRKPTATADRGARPEPVSTARPNTHPGSALPGTGALPSPECRRPAPDSFKVTYVSLPLARGLGSASGPGRRFGLCQPPDPHKEGTKDERISSRRQRRVCYLELAPDSARRWVRAAHLVRGSG
jgi:hypothetical protein